VVVLVLTLFIIDQAGGLAGGPAGVSQALTSEAGACAGAGGSMDVLKQQASQQNLQQLLQQQLGVALARLTPTQQKAARDDQQALHSKVDAHLKEQLLVMQGRHAQETQAVQRQHEGRDPAVLAAAIQMLHQKVPAAPSPRT
jgi:hypothetical protein